MTARYPFTCFLSLWKCSLDSRPYKQTIFCFCFRNKPEAVEVTFAGKVEIWMTSAVGDCGTKDGFLLLYMLDNDVSITVMFVLLMIDMEPPSDLHSFDLHWQSWMRLWIFICIGREKATHQPQLHKPSRPMKILP